MPCVHGNCSNNIDNFTCECTPGYTGVNCENDLDECESSPCNDNGWNHCINDINKYKCICAAGYSGENCEGKLTLRLILLLSKILSFFEHKMSLTYQLKFLFCLLLCVFSCLILQR